VPILAVTLHTVALAVHVTAVVVAFGVLFAYPALVVVVRRSSPTTLGALHRAQWTVARRITTPALALVTLAGIYLADDDRAFGEAWVVLSMVVIVVLMVLHRAVLIRGYRRLSELAPTEGPVSVEYRKLVRRVGAVELFSAALVPLTIYVMVARPFA
jgi:hypothetical protein